MTFRQYNTGSPRLAESFAGHTGVSIQFSIELPPTMISNKQLTGFFFAPLGNGLFRCNLCGHKQVRGSGFFNLLAHLAGAA